MATQTEIEILRNPIDRNVVKSCSEIHMQEIPDGFLPTFGIGFLTHLYQHISHSASSFLLVASLRGKVIGFICGSYGNGSLYRSFLVKKGILIAVPVALRLFTPGVLRKVLETLRYPTGVETDDLPGSEILNFCVSKASQGAGVGSTLFTALCREFEHKGVSRIRIVTGENQRAARSFYERIGAEEKATIQVHEGINSIVYVYELANVGACCA